MWNRSQSSDSNNGRQSCDQMQRPRAPNRVAQPSISAIIPAFNEEKTVGEIVSKTLRYVDEVIVIDDGSTDDTGVKAAEAGA